MFDQLDDFLNGASIIPRDNVPRETISNLDDSFDLDNYVPTNTKQTKKTKVDKNKNTKDTEKEEKKIVLSKTQMTAMKRLQKINAKLSEKLSDTPENAGGKKNSSMRSKTILNKRSQSAASSRSRAGSRSRGRSGRRPNYHMEIECDDSNDSDNDLSIMTESPTPIPPATTTSQRSIRHQRRNYDPDTIVLDCDDDFIGGPSVQITRNLADSKSCITSSDNNELQVSVMFNGKINKYTMRRFQKFTELTKQLSEQESLPVNQIILMFKHKPISTSESPDSIGYFQGLVIKAHLSNESNQSVTMPNNADHKNKLEIKIQASGRKKPFIVYIGKTEKLTKLAYDVAEEFKCNADTVRLEFDGEMINFDDTPEDMDFEGGEVLDFHSVKL